MFGNSLTHRLETGDGVKQKNEDKNKSRDHLFCEEEMIDFPVSSQKWKSFCGCGTQEAALDQ